ncbi:histidinol-phosphate aminotransferase family protein [Oceanospirillaceae bacterium]|nr:histidinol-phosphate aminotransferase family protein [bacterium]MDB4214367.1 histidinol-phosphate aminotransferase family protein [Oceanospirillaceae bacterium]
MSIRPRLSLLNPKLQRPSSLSSVPRETDQLWLDKNENLDPQLMAVTEDVLRQMQAVTLATYPEAGGLYKKLATWAEVEPEQLILTPGSDGAIRLVFEAFIEQGDKVIYTVPTFAMYPVYSQMFGADVLPIDYICKNGKPFLNSDSIIKILLEHKPKLLCLPNPDSPTGTTLDANVLKEILAVCESVGTVFLIDEAYHPFYEWSAVPWTKKSKNLIVARTFSKAWGVAGLRLGYAVAHPETASLLHKLRPMYEVSTFAIDFMSKMLDRKDEMVKSVARIQEGKDYFIEKMQSLEFETLPTSGNFLYVSFGEKGKEIHHRLANKVYYRESFDHPSLFGYTRFSVAPKSVMMKVYELIKDSVIKK